MDKCQLITIRLGSAMLETVSCVFLSCCLNLDTLIGFVYMQGYWPASVFRRVGKLKVTCWDLRFSRTTQEDVCDFNVETVQICSYLISWVTFNEFEVSIIFFPFNKYIFILTLGFWCQTQACARCGIAKQHGLYSNPAQ